MTLKKLLREGVKKYELSGKGIDSPPPFPPKKVFFKQNVKITQRALKTFLIKIIFCTVTPV